MHNFKHIFWHIFWILSRLALLWHHFRFKHRFQHHQISLGSYSEVCMLNDVVEHGICFFFPFLFRSSFFLHIWIWHLPGVILDSQIGYCIETVRRGSCSQVCSPSIDLKDDMLPTFINIFGFWMS